MFFYKAAASATARHPLRQKRRRLAPFLPLQAENQSARGKPDADGGAAWMTRFPPPKTAPSAQDSIAKIVKAPLFPCQNLRITLRVLLGVYAPYAYLN